MYIILSIYTTKFVPYVNVASALPIVIHYIQYIRKYLTPRIIHLQIGLLIYNQRTVQFLLFFVAKKHLT